MTDHTAEPVSSTPAAGCAYDAWGADFGAVAGARCVNDDPLHRRAIHGEQPGEPLAQGGIVTPDAQPEAENGGSYLAPADVLRAAADAADDAICRRLDHNQVIALVADAVWRLAYERGHAKGRREAVAAVQRPDQLAYERGIAEGLRQATEGLSREWGTRVPSYDLVDIHPDEAAARRWVAEAAPVTVEVVSRLVGPWEPVPDAPNLLLTEEQPGEPAEQPPVVEHALGCMCGTNDAGQRFDDPICRRKP